MKYSNLTTEQLERSYNHMIDFWRNAHPAQRGRKTGFKTVRAIRRELSRRGVEKVASLFERSMGTQS